MDLSEDESGLHFEFRNVEHGEKLDASFSVWPAADFYIELPSQKAAVAGRAKCYGGQRGSVEL
ncbi:MAG TPA: hypothetical protein VFJ58_16165 [Armatimonadota bacterium]|nr:hypothetical protein [Armatimonadota bacterium]